MTRVSDQQYIPFTVAALPAEPPPTANAIAAHARAVATYNWRLARYNDPARDHECFRICNVRYICGQSPYGTITNYDTGFPVTELPTLDPTTANPRRWADWYSFS